MEDTVKSESLVQTLAEFIEDHKGVDTVAMYIGEHSSFTDYFVITTVSSWIHLKGLFRELKGFLSASGIQPINHQRIMNEDTWVLIDCGSIVIHLMNEEMRNFYELEKLWFSGKTVYQSSKSSKSSPSS
jgi:ribosome-associated protein